MKRPSALARAFIVVGAMLLVASVGLALAAIWTDGDLSDRLTNTACLAFFVGGTTLVPALVLGIDL